MPPKKVNIKHIIMSNEQEVVVDHNNETEVTETGVETGEEVAKESKVEKTKRTPEEELAYFEGRAKRLRKDLGLEETESKPKKTTQKSDDLDYGQKAFLAASGYKETSEMELVKNIMSETGKTIEQVLASKYFQAEIKEARELQASSNALPKDGKRTGSSSQDTVEYWLAKGELPPVSNRKLREQVVDARIEKDKNKGMFYNS